jgi:hypothetical protein
MLIHCISKHFALGLILILDIPLSWLNDVKDWMAHYAWLQSVFVC